MYPSPDKVDRGIGIHRSRRQEMDKSYWTTVTMRRISRRRLLAGAGAATGAAALLAACGSNDNGAAVATKTPANSLVAQQIDTTKDAKRGGALKLSASSEP